MLRKRGLCKCLALSTVGVGMAFLTVACSTTITPPDNGDGADTGGGNSGVVSFATDIQPIFTAQCARCHTPGGIADLAGIDARLLEGEAYDDIVNIMSVQQEEFVLVVPGDSAASLLFLKISSSSPPVGNRMPLFSTPLSSGEIALIRDWIDQGAQDN